MPRSNVRDRGAKQCRDEPLGCLTLLIGGDPFVLYRPQSRAILFVHFFGHLTACVVVAPVGRHIGDAQFSCGLAVAGNYFHMQ